MNPRTLLVRGMLVGVVAGLFAFVFAYLVGEGPVNQAILFEGAHDAAGEPELVSRGVQSTLGLATAVLVFGAAAGGVFAIAFAFAYGRLGQLGVRATALGVAGAAFLVFALVPVLKYPANPPAVGQGETIGRRSALFLALLIISVVAVVGAVVLGRALTARLGNWDAVLVAALAFAVAIALAGALLPTVDEVPADFPATVLWRFRLASLGTQLVLWTSLGLIFGAVTERRLQRREPVLQSVAVK
jgi:predicted cobalt transporter CbtA